MNPLQRRISELKDDRRKPPPPPCRFSPAANAVLATLEHARRQIAALVAARPEHCRCPDCLRNGPGDALAVVHHLVGLAWSLEIATAVVSSFTLADEQVTLYLEAR
jgi:hypothetical protein